MGKCEIYGEEKETEYYPSWGQMCIEFLNRDPQAVMDTMNARLDAEMEKKMEAEQIARMH